MLKSSTLAPSSHAFLGTLAANGVDRVFLVPGESYLGVLDALNDFPDIDVVTCRHEAGAGFMAVADGRLTRRPGVALVSRGPGATNASIAVHTAQQDAVPMILIVGQVPVASLRRGAFQEIDYFRMFGGIAKWVVEPTDPAQLAEVAAKAMHVAVSGTPGPVVVVLPEDIQQQLVPNARVHLPLLAGATPRAESVAALRRLLEQAERPLIVAGGGFDVPGGRTALLRFAEAWQVPVAVSFRRHDVFPNCHPLYVGDLGLANPEQQMAAFHSSDVLLALGTRLGDITSQGYTFPRMPRPAQTVVHCYPDAHPIGLHFAVDLGLPCDPLSLVSAALPLEESSVPSGRACWAGSLRGLYEDHARWPAPSKDEPEGLAFVDVVKTLARAAPENSLLCLDAGTFAAPFYRHYPFGAGQRLFAPLSGAMGFGVPAALAAQLREPGTRVVCAVGDGGFMMTGNEMIMAVARHLPILLILSNNNNYGSIRAHQDREYPGRHAGTTLVNPDFTATAHAFGMAAEHVTSSTQVEDAINRGLNAAGPYLIEVRTRLTQVAQTIPPPTFALSD
ncbi:pyruvate decarboxylase [Verticiella sediminum]|uniref:Pyruvate decarboxylase n=1 Tax=Verticiella sediminum TaxID=1247510 RepID=A0A556AWS7_9BURK|nr:thiamine pyrophosphate-binding protein [Verticiella sediminum]TSH97387.1 pyruvate decarboxylase [Verticiella sediminum]